MLQDTEVNYPEVSAPSGVLAATRQADSEAGKLSLLEFVTLLVRCKKTILLFALTMAILAAIVAFVLMKPTYTAEAVLLPPQTSPGGSMMQLASQLGSFGAIGGLGGLKNPGDIYVGILGSRTIADSLIKQFDLQEVYKTKKLSDAEKGLQHNSKFVLGKDNLVTISVDDHDPNRAYKLANGYLSALYEQNGRLALTEASQRRLFFEEQLKREKDALADAEVELKKTEEQTGLIAPVGQAQVVIESIAEIRAQIASRQVELAALRQSATDQNPAVVRLQSEIAGMQQQLQKMQSDNAPRQPGSVEPPTARVPSLALEYVRKEREVKYHEVLFELIAKQYESARLDESRQAPVLQVIDYPSVPDRKSGPPRALLTLGGFLLGLFAGVSWVTLKHYIRIMKQDPTKATELEALRRAVLIRH